MNNIIIPQTREEAKMLILHAKPYTVLDNLNPIHFDDVFESVMPTLSSLATLPCINAKRLAEEYTTMALVQAQQMLNVCPKLEDQAIRRTARLVLEDYTYLNILDLVLCMKMGIKGQLADFYGRFDAQVVYEWFRAYCAKREEALRYFNAK